MDPDLDDTVVGAPRLPGDGVVTLDPNGAGAAALRAEAALRTAPPAPAPLYGFRIGLDGEIVTLDATTIVGRRPRPPRIPSPQPPRLVAVVSPTSDVSSTHLELRQRGSSVIVTDLHSTNGSIVTIPGSAPTRLRPGEAMVVTPGTLIDIGDGNRIEILSPRLAAPHHTIGAPS